MRCAARELLARRAHSRCRADFVLLCLNELASSSKTLAISTKKRLAAVSATRHAAADLRLADSPLDCSEPTPSKTLCETTRQTSSSLLAQGRRRPIPRRA